MGRTTSSRVHHTRQMRRRRARRRLERLDLNSILLEVDILLAWERCGVRCPSTWVACFFPSTPLPDELQCSFHHHHTLHRHSTTLQDLIPDPAGLTLRSCDTERQTDVDTKLEAVLGPPTCRRHSAMTLTQSLALVYSDLPETVACSSISSRRLRTTYTTSAVHTF